MVTAHPVPHRKENPGKGEMPGSKRAARGWGIVSGRLDIGTASSTESSKRRGQRPPVAPIRSEMRCTTIPSIPRSPCGDIPSHGSECLAIWLLVTITSSLRGERVRAESTLGASPGGVSAQVSWSLLTMSTGTAIEPGSASKIVSPPRAVRVTDEASTAPHTFDPRCAAPLTAAVVPALVPISQTGRMTRERTKSIALLMASA